MSNTNALESYIERIHQSAANGDVAAILEALKVLPDVNVMNSRGWTALMFAARNGHKDATVTLIDKGSDVMLTNSIGQTARDIAEFWQHRDVAAVLSERSENTTSTAASPTMTSDPDTNPNGPRKNRRSNYFCDNPLNRMSQKRTDDVWLNGLKSNPSATFIVLTKLQPIVCSSDVPPLFRLVRFSREKVKKFLDAPIVSTVIFLGIEELNNNEDDATDAERVGWFAIDGGDLTVEEMEPGAVALPFPLGFLQLSRAEAAIAGQARSLIAWHERYKFCSTCGGSTEIKEAGYKITCLKTDCPSNKGVHNTCYPRTDPTVIMAVVSTDRSQILLGRGKRFRSAAMWSCLAGFMEPGESIEEACRREVFEESGIKVGYVEYHSCQPWPMPSSLMIGCIAYAETLSINVDKTELEDAKWFSHLEVRQMMSNQHPHGYFCPPDQAIAHQLISHWLHKVCKL